MVVLLLSPLEEAVKSCDQECLKGQVEDRDHDSIGHGGILENR